MKRWNLTLIGLCIAFPSFASDTLFDLESRNGDITVMYERTIRDFSEMNHLLKKDPSTLNVVVQTLSKQPNAIEYESARAYAESLKDLFPHIVFTTDSAAGIAADYLFIVGSSAGRDESEATRTVYGSRSTGVTCADSFGSSIVCRETSSSSTPIGTKTVTLVDRYVDVNIVLAKPILHDNPEPRPDGSKVLWETLPIIQDSFSVVYEPGGCKNELSAVTLIASMLGSDAITEKRPRKFHFQSKPRNLNCNER